MKQEEIKNITIFETEFDDWRSAVYVANKFKLWGLVVVELDNNTGKYHIKNKE